jgi:ketosteroid isomerase-like protein
VVFLVDQTISCCIILEHLLHIIKEVLMKACSLVALICVLLIGCKPPEQFDAAAVKAKIDAACEAQEQASVKGDVIGEASGYEENAVILPSNEPMVKGKANIEKWISGWMQSGMKMKEFTSTTISVEGAGEYAIQLGRYFQTFEISGKVIADTGKFVTVWRKQADGSWKMAYDMWNTDIPAPAMPPEPVTKKKE